MEIKTLDIFQKTVHYEESRLIWVRPVCDFFRIDVRNQHKKIKSDPVLGKLVEKNTPDLGRRIVNHLLRNALTTRYQYSLNFREIPQIS